MAKPRKKTTRRRARKPNRLTLLWRQATSRLTPQVQRAARIGLLAGVAALAAAGGFLLARHLTDEPVKQTAAVPSRPPAKPAAKPADRQAPKATKPSPQQAAVPRPPAPPGDGRQPAWLRHAVAAPPASAGRPMIAIVIDDMGLDRPRSMRTLELPAPLTLAYLPYGKDLESQTALARFKGHELMVHLPMEPSGSADPGPEALLTGLGEAELRRRIAANLAHFDAYVGVNNHMGSKFTAWRPGMEIVIDEMKKRGLLFLDSRTSAHSVAAELANAAGVPNAARQVFLDDVLSSDNVWQQLGETETIARRNGYAIAIGHPHDNTLAALEKWLPALKEKGLALVPLTTIVRQRNGG